MWAVWVISRTGSVRLLNKVWLFLKLHNMEISIHKYTYSTTFWRNKVNKIRKKPGRGFCRSLHGSTFPIPFGTSTSLERMLRGVLPRLDGQINSTIHRQYFGIQFSVRYITRLSKGDPIVGRWWNTFGRRFSLIQAIVMWNHYGDVAQPQSKYAEHRKDKVDYLLTVYGRMPDFWHVDRFTTGPLQSLPPVNLYHHSRMMKATTDAD